ncbi:MAG: hypothetical protein KKI08_03290 [Armatimonadetes bacterium]|nr:hypothetical protein [Armatimonadota bacterium]
MPKDDVSVESRESPGEMGDPARPGAESISWRTVAAHIGWRILFYGLGIAAAAYITRIPGPPDASGYRYAEWCPVELVALALLALTALVVWWAAAVDPIKRPVAVLMALAAATAFVRETYSAGDTGVLATVWCITAGVAPAVMLIYAYRQRRRLVTALGDLTALSALPMMIIGMLIVAVFAQIMGVTAHWKAVLGDQYVHNFKRVMEEAMEVVGYTVVFGGAVEYLLAAYARRRQGRTAA